MANKQINKQTKNINRLLKRYTIYVIHVYEYVRITRIVYVFKMPVRPYRYYAGLYDIMTALKSLILLCDDGEVNNATTTTHNEQE